MINPEGGNERHECQRNWANDERAHPGDHDEQRQGEVLQALARTHPGKAHEPGRVDRGKKRDDDQARNAFPSRALEHICNWKDEEEQPNNGHNPSEALPGSGAHGDRFAWRAGRGVRSRGVHVFHRASHACINVANYFRSRPRRTTSTAEISKIIAQTTRLRIGTHSALCPWHSPSVEIIMLSVIGYWASAIYPYRGVNFATVSIAPVKGKNTLPKKAKITSKPLAALTAASDENASPAASPYSAKTMEPTSTKSAESAHALSSEERR